MLASVPFVFWNKRKQRSYQVVLATCRCTSITCGQESVQHEGGEKRLERPGKVVGFRRVLLFGFHINYPWTEVLCIYIAFILLSAKGVFLPISGLAIIPMYFYIFDTSLVGCGTRKQPNQSPKEF